MNKKFGIIAIILCGMSLLISIITMTIVLVNMNNKNEAGDIQYVLYVGTNDKDTNLPVFDEETSKEEAKKILLDHFGGYTIQEANGGWKDGTIVYKEYTLVIYLSDTTIDEVHLACKAFIEKFNQSSILIQSNKTTTEFYAG